MSDKPNILIIWGDDIGLQTNLSCYSHGVLMGYRTPNIDRIAAEGAMFTDYYGEQSCTAGRAAFITGQYSYRTGLTKVGLPGAQLGLQAEDPTIATALKAQGYATGQFGKNHLGDRDEHLPTHALASTSSSATSITSTPKRNPSSPTIRRIRSSARSSARAACYTPTPTATAPSASRTPARSPRSGWKLSITSSVTRQSISSSASILAGPTSRSLSGSTRPTCISAPTPNRRASDGPGVSAVRVPRHHVGSRRPGGQPAGDPRRARDHGQHNRHVLHDNGSHMSSWPMQA